MSKLKYLLTILGIALLLVACGSSESADSHDHDDHGDEEKTAETHDDHDDEEHSDEEHDDHDDDEEKEHDDHDDEDHDEHGDEDHDDHDDENREHGAHEHGAAELNIAWSGNEVAVDLITPSYNLLGFEYAPSTDAEKQAAADVIAALEQGAFMQFSADAECGVVSAEIDAGFLEADGDDDSTHSDVDAEYTIECVHPEDLASLDLSELFSQFGNFEDLRVQWISDDGASAETVTATSTTVSFE